jgi:hypothetical protein
MAFVISVHE